MESDKSAPRCPEKFPRNRSENPPASRRKPREISWVVLVDLVCAYYVAFRGFFVLFLPADFFTLM